MIELVDISCEIAGKKILTDVFLKVDRGEILALLGLSGSGKTTLLRIIAGLMRHDSGEVRLDGGVANTPDHSLAPGKRRMAMIFQGLALWPHMTVRKNIEFAVNRNTLKSKEEIRSRIDRLLSAMHLEAYQARYPGELSGGERQRLAIARALAVEPRCLLMDEPFSNLDDHLRSELLRLTKSLKTEGRMAIIYVTHNIDEALLVGDKIAMIKKGTIHKTWQDDDLKFLTKSQILESYI